MAAQLGHGVSAETRAKISAAKLRMRVAPCAGCGREFEPSKDQRTHAYAGGGIYCSPGCRPHTGPAKRRVEVRCAACGVAFEKQAAHAAKSEQHYCGRACYFESRKHGEERQCATCGNAFWVPPWIAKRRDTQRGRWCSMACYTRSAFQRAHQQRAGKLVPAGERHPLWRGGNGLYYGPNWREQARVARERDGHTCQDCGLTQRRPLLDVHHLVRRRSFGDDFELGNRLENLVTVCKTCHSQREAAITRQLLVVGER